MPLPQSLAALGAYRQFILCTLPGKLPTSPITGQVGINAHDSQHWTDCQTAEAAAQRTGHSVAFVITAADPVFCLDIDGALQPDGTWSQLSLDVLAALPGAGCEVSQSGRGLHVWGMYQAIPPHACKNTQLGLELYHEGRFICLGRPDATGDAAMDCTALLPAVVTRWFTPQLEGVGAVEGWTEQPCPEWRGPADDVQLVERMLSSRSNPFSGKASVQDLWTRNVDALAKSYPSSSGDVYDGSSADAALAAHLAFWTGRDCARMERLMRASQLVREKWEREDYLPRTILRACAVGGDVYQERRVEALPEAAACAAPSPVVVEGSTFANAEAQLEIFKGCVYVCGLHKVLVPGGRLLRPEQFNALAPYSKYTYMLDHSNEKTTRKAFEALTQSQCFTFPHAHACCFRPELPPAHIVGDLVNTWWPEPTVAVEGDVAPFVRHMEKILPDQRDREILLAYAAALVQFPGDKFQWWPLLQGTQGNGKTLLLEVLEYCVGDRYSHRPNAAEIAGGGGKFTAWLERKILIGLEEVKTSHKVEMLEILKPIVTNHRIEIQGKGVDQFTGDNRANGILHSNYKDAIAIAKGDRRYAVFYTAQQEVEHLERDGMTGRYFPDLYRWLRHEGGLTHLNHWLRNYTIPAELNPALNHGGLCHRAPITSSSDEALQLGLGRVEQEVLEAVAEHRVGFCGGWISSIELDTLLNEKRVGGLVPRVKRPEMLKTIGYIHHPALYGGRATSPTVSGARPVLYIKSGHPNGNITGGPAITKAYEAAQTASMAGVFGNNSLTTASS